MKEMEVPLYLEDLTSKAQRKLAAIYSHATGTEIQVRDIYWPSPVITMLIELDNVVVNDREGEPLSHLPKPVRQHRRTDMLGCLVYLVSIVAGLYLIAQAVRYAIG